MKGDPPPKANYSTLSASDLTEGPSLALSVGILSLTKSAFATLHKLHCTVEGTEADASLAQFLDIILEGMQVPFDLHDEYLSRNF